MTDSHLLDVGLLGPSPKNIADSHYDYCLFGTTADILTYLGAARQYMTGSDFCHAGI